MSDAKTGGESDSKEKHPLDTEPLVQLIESNPKCVRVMQVLIDQVPGQDWSATTIADKAGVSNQTAYDALDSLESYGLASSRQEGGTTLWKQADTDVSTTFELLSDEIRHHS